MRRTLSVDQSPLDPKIRQRLYRDNHQEHDRRSESSESTTGSGGTSSRSRHDEQKVSSEASDTYATARMQLAKDILDLTGLLKTYTKIFVHAAPGVSEECVPSLWKNRACDRLTHHEKKWAKFKNHLLSLPTKKSIQQRKITLLKHTNERLSPSSR